MKGNNSTTRAEVEEDIKGQTELIPFLVLFRKGVSCVPPLWLASSCFAKVCARENWDESFLRMCKPLMSVEKEGEKAFLLWREKMVFFYYYVQHFFSQEEIVIFPEAIKTDDISTQDL